MKTKNYTLLLLCSMLILVGCSNLEPDWDQKKKEQPQQETALEKKTLQEIWSKWDETLAEKYENISFASDLSLEQPDNVYIAKLIQAADVLEKEQQILDAYIPKERYQKKYYKKEAGTNPPGPEYSDTKTGEWFGLGDNGFLNYEKNKYVGEYESEIEETIFLNRPYKDKKVMLRDGEILLSEAVTLADEQIKKWESLVPNDYTARVRKVDICVSSKVSQKKVLRFYYEKCFKKINILTDQRVLTTDADIPLSVEYIPCFDDVVTVASVKEAEGFNTNAGVVYEKEVVKELPQIISLEGALEKVSEVMAAYHMNTVKKITLSYRLCNSQGELCQHGAGTIYETNPCWVFYFNEKKDSEEFAIVDCQTGSVDYIRNY